MQANLLKAKLVENDMTVWQLTEEMAKEQVKMSVPSYYQKLRGDTEFRRDEISAIAKVLNLTGKDVLKIFFEGVEQNG